MLAVKHRREKDYYWNHVHDVSLQELCCINNMNMDCCYYSFRSDSFHVWLEVDDDVDDKSDR